VKREFNILPTLGIASATILLTACGGSSSSSDNPNSDTVLTGQFVDSQVANIGYETASQSGFTNANGEFSFIAGESVTFSIGDATFPATTAKALITPLDILDSSDTSEESVVNMARLLQTLDEDGNPENGIQITDDAHTQAMSLEIDFTSDTFEDDVVNLVANSGSLLTSLIDSASAEQHLEQTLDDLGVSYGTEESYDFELTATDNIWPNSGGSVKRLPLEASFSVDGDSCSLVSEEGYSSDDCTIEDSEVNLPFGEGTFTPNSVTIINYPSPCDESLDECVSADFHGTNSTPTDTVITAGTYSINGEELIGSLQGSGSRSYSLSGTFVVYEDQSCSMENNEGDLSRADCQIVNNSLVVTATGLTAYGGTISENSLTIFFIGGDSTEKVASYLHGTRQ
jgi:hypothetical protein